jgi:type I restriction enzyme, S subunit
MLAAQPEIEALGEGSTGQTELSRSRLGAFRITVPAQNKAAEIRPILDTLEVKGGSALAESITLAELRDAILPGLMSGEVPVREAEKVVEEAT